MTLLIIIAIISYALAIVAFGRGPLFINNNILGAIINSIGALVPMLIYVLAGPSQRVAGSDLKKGVLYSLLGGIAIGIFTLALTRVFASGQNVSFVTPLVYGGAVIVSTLIGILLFREQPHQYTILGMILIALGIMSISYATYVKGAMR